jgi:signal transduction histidine kinase
LVVDDRVLIGKALRLMLAPERDIEICFCTDPELALRLATAIAPTCIMQDLVMPEVDGLKQLRRYRADPGLKDIPVIVLSSREDPKVKAEAFAAGANDYLVKLPDKVEVVARIRYHSRAYVNLLERDQAFAILEDNRRMLVEANAAKSTFLANMSHELRTPLNAILGFSELLREEAEDAGQEDLIPDLKKIEAAGSHLLDLINDVLALSRIEAGKMNLFLETFEIAALIQEVFESVSPLVEKNANTLEGGNNRKLGLMKADLPKVRQILNNLISNACKFTEGGTISLEVHREIDDEVEWVLFEVTDTGSGIDAEQIDNLFRAYMQDGASTDREFGGSGLGLELSQRYCEMMGGRITVESAVGKGSTFRVRLPVEVAEYQPSSGVTGDD